MLPSRWVKSVGEVPCRCKAYPTVPPVYPQQRHSTGAHPKLQGDPLFPPSSQEHCVVMLEFVPFVCDLSHGGTPVVNLNSGLASGRQEPAKFSFRWRPKAIAAHFQQMSHYEDLVNIIIFHY
jgi:hypothetical protein